LESRNLLAGTPQLIEINPGTNGSLFLPGTNVGNWSILFAQGATGGYELWKSDGTAAGTTMIKDIVPGPGGSYPYNFTDVNRTLFFTVGDEPSEYGQLWKSNGTEAGTVLVKDVGGKITEPINVMGTLFFSVTGAPEVTGLWKSDGTSAGTIRVKALEHITKFQDFAAENLTNVRGTLFFTAVTSTSGAELWRSDGTDTGTVMIRDLTPGFSSSSPTTPLTSAPLDLTEVNGSLFFSAFTSEFGAELYKSDGTFDGTVLVKDINPGASGSEPAGLTNVNGALFFRANNGTSGMELFRSDGSSGGTVLVRDLFPGVDSAGEPNSGSPIHMTNVNGTLFFSARDTSSNFRLFRSGGTSATTVPVNSEPVSGRDPTLEPINLINGNGTLYYIADDAGGTPRLHASNGTLAGTKIVSSTLAAGNPNLNPYSSNNCWLVNGRLFFLASTPATGLELAVFDTGGELPVKLDGVSGPFVNNLGVRFRGVVGAGVTSFGLQGMGVAAPSTPNTLVELKDGILGTALVNPLGFTELNGTTYFSAIGSSGDRELYFSRGGFANRVDLNPGLSSSNPADFTAVNGDLYFTAETPANGRELWRRDGTTGFYARVRDIWGGMDSSDPRNLINYNGRLYFTAYTPTQGRELWTSDGTNAGTRIVLNINTGSESSTPDYLTVSRNTLYFAATTVLGGRELWKFDGTTASLVKNINLTVTPAIGSSNPRDLIDINGQLYFVADDGINGEELWRTNGSSAGTTMLRNLNPTGSSNPRELTAVRGQLFFRAFTPENGSELWRRESQGGVFNLVKDIVPGTGSSFPMHLTDVNGVLAFVPAAADGGSELWRSNGNESGTTRVVDLRAGGSSVPDHLFAHQGRLYFSADDGVNGRELWMSQMFDFNTQLVRNIRSGSASSNPSGFTSCGPELYFAATKDDGVRGTWIYRTDPPAAMPPAPMRPMGMIAGSLPPAGSTPPSERLAATPDVTSPFEDSKLKASIRTFAGAASETGAEIESTVFLAAARSSDSSASDKLLDQLFTHFAETFDWEDKLLI
jgi:ELWxxDGT repeat protein